MKTDLFRSCGHCWVFLICWHIECSTFTSSFRIWTSSTGIPWPPLALFLVMLSKAHLTLHSNMSGSRWVITPSWLSGSLRPFLYSSSVYSYHLLFSFPSVAAAAKSLQSCPTDSAWPHRQQPTRVPRPWDLPGKNTGVGCHFLLQCMKVKSLSRVRLLATPWTAAYQAPLSVGFARQEYCSGLPLPSPLLLLGLYNFCPILSPPLHETFPWYLIFLKRSLVLPTLLFSSISLHWSLRKAFLSLLAILWNSAFRWIYLLICPLPFTSLLFSATWKASSDNHFAFLNFFSWGWFYIFYLLLIIIV